MGKEREEGAYEPLQATPRGPGRPSPYPDLFARLRANCEVDEFTGCWEWQGHLDRYGYPKVTIRVDGKPTGLYAHRVMLELAHGYLFPYDDAGHLCNNPKCINPQHLEIQSPAFNLSDRRGYAPCKPGKRMIPVLYPIEGWTPHPIIDAILNPSDDCPF